MNMKKIVASASALALTAAVAVGGTLAYLQVKTAPLENTFTLGNLAVTLTETEGDDGATQMVPGGALSYTNVAPGVDLHKDPTIKVTEGDQAWVYIGVNNPNENGEITFTPNSDWTEVGTTVVDDVSYTVYGYNSVVAKNGSQTLSNTVHISENVEVGSTLEPITVIGFGVQYDGEQTALNSVQNAWANTFGAPEA